MFAIEFGSALPVSSSLRATIVDEHFDEAVVVPVLVLVVYVGPILLGPIVSVVLGTYEVDMVVAGGDSSKVPSCPGYSFVEKKIGGQLLVWC